jgi:hypothetical protein
MTGQRRGALAGVVRAGPCRDRRSVFARFGFATFKGSVPDFLCEWPNRTGDRRWTGRAPARERCANPTDGIWGCRTKTVEGACAGIDPPALRGLFPRHTCACGRGMGFHLGPAGDHGRRHDPEECRGAGRSLFRAIDAILPRPGSTGRHGPDQRLCHRPGAYGRLHGRAGPLVRRDGAASGLHAGDRGGLHPARVQGRGRGRRGAPAPGAEAT